MNVALSQIYRVTLGKAELIAMLQQREPNNVAIQSLNRLGIDVIIELDNSGVALKWSKERTY